MHRGHFLRPTRNKKFKKFEQNIAYASLYTFTYYENIFRVSMEKIWEECKFLKYDVKLNVVHNCGTSQLY